jgi:hypothetical protein
LMMSFYLCVFAALKRALLQTNDSCVTWTSSNTFVWRQWEYTGYTQRLFVRFCVVAGIDVERRGFINKICLFLARQPPSGTGPPHSRGF